MVTILSPWLLPTHIHIGKVSLCLHSCGHNISTVILIAVDAVAVIMHVELSHCVLCNSFLTTLNIVYACVWL